MLKSGGGEEIGRNGVDKPDDTTYISGVVEVATAQNIRFSGY